MRAILATGILGLSLGAAHAQTVERIDITEYGIYTTDTAATTAAPGTATGKIDQVSNIKLVQSTTTIPARQGIEFGFRYKIIHIPKPGMRNPETGNVTLTNVFYQEHKVGEELYRLYRLIDRWEIVPGVWTLEIWDGERKLLSQDFLLKK
jgi:hypothetical protein